VTFRTGVHVGSARVTISNRKLGPTLPVTFTGPLVPVASRLAHSAGRGEALVSDDTVEVAGRTLDGCERVSFVHDRADRETGGTEAGPAKVMKGVVRPVGAWVIQAQEH
jgi:class 3 adenylate cyclase